MYSQVSGSSHNFKSGVVANKYLTHLQRRTDNYNLIKRREDRYVRLGVFTATDDDVEMDDHLYKIPSFNLFWEDYPTNTVSRRCLENPKDLYVR